MKNSWRFAFLLLLVLTTFFACSKKSGFDEPFGNQFPPVFNSSEQAGDAVSRYLQQVRQGEQFIRINNILYMESGNKTYALVYYESSAGSRNILFEKEYQGQTVVAASHYECSGSTCDCKVAATIGQNGEVTINCSCTGCTMSVSEFNP